MNCSLISGTYIYFLAFRLIGRVGQPTRAFPGDNPFTLGETLDRRKAHGVVASSMRKERSPCLHGGVNQTRREFLRKSGAVPSTLLLLTLAEADESRAATIPPTPACPGNPEATPPQTAGPFFLPRSPLRTSLLGPGIGGRRVLLTGRVLTTRCLPVPGALLDFWQADAAGVYDVRGYRLRGHQFADREGRYRVETIVAGLYPGRTRHIHVIVQAPNGRPVTTQLYFPREPRNVHDGHFDRRLLMSIDLGSGGYDFVARYDFVLA
jgi:protocatechuate 3,4-dioxygenase beta subunit